MGPVLPVVFWPPTGRSASVKVFSESVLVLVLVLRAGPAGPCCWLLSPAVTPQQFVKLHFPSTPHPNLSSFSRTRISIASRPHATSALPSLPDGRLLFGDCISNRPSPASARLRFPTAYIALPSANTSPTVNMSSPGVRAAPPTSASTALRHSATHRLH